MLKVSRRRSPSTNVLDTDAFVENKAGPSIVFRPALPNDPAEGTVKAKGLKNCPGKTAPTVIPAALARSLPTDPVPPEFDWLPRIRAVNGEPDCAVKVVVSVQSLSSLPPTPVAGRKEPFPAGDEKIQFQLSVCRWSKLDNP